jgi:PAS domain S-box-containing protein
VNNVPSEQSDTSQEKAFSKDQFLKYARDIGALYEREVTQRKALELANRQLRGEILDRIRLQDELLQSERRYRSLFEESHEAIFITNCDGILVDANNACLKLIGRSREEVIGSSFLEKCSTPSAQDVFGKRAQESDGMRDVEFQLRRPDNTVRDCRLTASVWRSGHGNVLGYQGIVRDITEEKRRQRIFELACRMEAISHMAEGIAHEIRNPMAISSSAAQLLINEKLASHLKKECVEKVVSGINRASLIVENLLAFARPMSDYTVAKVDLVEIIADTLRTATAHAASQNVELVSQLGHESLWLMGNAELLHKAFLNLLVNGLAAMPTGGRLAVSVERNAHTATIDVTDSGIGLTSEQAAKVFDPFFGGLATTKGVGLGLSVAYSIVCHHEGTIQVESILGEGSTFRVSLPLSHSSP